MKKTLDCANQYKDSELMRTGATILAAFLLILASCASHTAVYPDPVNIQSVIEPGDTVKIVTKDNQETEFEVTEVTDEAIFGENIKVLLSDITGMKQETVSAGKNALMITILTVGVTSAVILAPPAAILYSGAISLESAAISSTLGAVSGFVEGEGCEPYYPEFHLGDEFATGLVGTYGIYENQFGYEGIYVVEYIGIDERMCIEECDSKYSNTCGGPLEDFRQKYFKGLLSCHEKSRACKFECIEKGHPVGDIAEHVEGGYYSDGSYYSICESGKLNPFVNVHPTKDKYEKTKWQKDRDECMRLTYDNVKSKPGGVKFFKKSNKYYRECLNERGYSITVY